MRPLLVVGFDPGVEVVLQARDRGIGLLAEGDAVELIEDGLVEALSDAIRLRALRLGPRMVDVLDREIKLVVVMLGIPCRDQSEHARAEPPFRRRRARPGHSRDRPR